MFALENLLERAERVRDFHVLPGRRGELLGDEERLREEPLQAPRARDDRLVLVGELLHSEDRDDVLQVLVPLEDLLDLAGDAVVLLSGDGGFEESRHGPQRVDRGVDPELDDAPVQHDVRVKVRERGRRGGVGDVVRRDVDRLDRRQGASLRRGDPFLERGHLLRERRLVAHGARHAAEKRRDLGARLHEAEDVVDEDQHVRALGVAEIFREGDGGERDAEARAGGLVHLAEDHGRLVQDGHLLALRVLELGLLHFEPEVVAFAGALADAAEDGDAAVLGGDVADELLHEHRLAHAGSAEESDLAALRKRAEKVDDLEPCLENPGRRLLVHERRGRAVDGIPVVGLDVALVVDRLAQEIHDAPKRAAADRKLDRVARVPDLHSADEAVRRRQGNRPHHLVAQVEGDLGRHVDVPCLVLDLQRGINGRQFVFKLHVHHRPDHLRDLSRVLGHLCLLSP